MTRKKQFLLIVLYTCLGIGISYFGHAEQAHAATLEISPSTISRNTGDTFSVGVFVSTPETSANAVSGTVLFDRNVLDVVSISKTNSVLNLWIQEPSFSNQKGIVEFEGIILNPGYKGAKGNILNVVFRAKTSGTARVRFSSGSILANDGTGTNILEEMKEASFLIKNSSEIQQSAQQKSDTVPTEQSSRLSEDGAPTIVSNTHPDQARWYKDKNPIFSWTLPEGAIDIRTGFGSSRSLVPKLQHNKVFTNRQVTEVQDGTHYFALQIKTAEGWGKIARYQVNIDSIPPREFSITFPHGSKSLEPQPVILFNTTDDGSGVHHYDVKIEGGGPARVEPAAVSNPYVLTPQLPGSRIVLVTAVDEAGNTTSTSSEFTIEAIDAPTITHYQDEIFTGDIFKIRGTTYPNSDITVFIKQDGNMISEEYTRSNSLGDFSVVVTKRLLSGKYSFTARVTDSRGANSDESEQFVLTVKSALIQNITHMIVHYLSVIILIVAALGVTIGVVVHMWHRLRRIIQKFDEDTKETKDLLEKTFAILKEDVDEHIRVLERAKTKRKLTAEESSFLKRFGQNTGQ